MPRAAPPAPPNTPKSCRTDQGPNRDAAAAAGPEQTGLADRAPAARSAAAAGSPLAARWQVRAAVSDPDCSWPAPGRPSGSGAAGAMSRVGEALREQRGGGCVRLDERRASRAACLSCGLCAQLTWPSRYCGTTVSKLWAAGRGQCGEDGRSSPHWVLPKRQFGRPLVPRPAAARSGLTVHFLYVLSARAGRGPPRARGRHTRRGHTICDASSQCPESSDAGRGTSGRPNWRFGRTRAGEEQPSSPARPLPAAQSFDTVVPQ